MGNVIKIKRGPGEPSPIYYQNIGTLSLEQWTEQRVYLYEKNNDEYYRTTSYNPETDYYTLAGDLYPYELGYNTDNGWMYINNGENVTNLTRKIFVQNEDPLSSEAVEGDLWIDTSSLQGNSTGFGVHYLPYTYQQREWNGDHNGAAGWQSLHYIPLSPGVWQVMGQCTVRPGSNTSTYASLHIGTSSTDYNNYVLGRQAIYLPKDGWYGINTNSLIKVTDPSEYHLLLWLEKAMTIAGSKLAVTKMSGLD